MINKISLLGSYKDRITVLNEDGIKVIKRYAKNKSSFFYIDPPYYVKGADLYLNAFRHSDHERLAKTLKQCSESKWLLSYDNEKAILDLYPEFDYEVFSLKYSAHQNTRLGSELMIFSKSINTDIIKNLE